MFIISNYYCIKYVRICKIINSIFVVANGYMNESIAEFYFEFEYKVSIDIAKTGFLCNKVNSECRYAVSTKCFIE